MSIAYGTGLPVPSLLSLLLRLLVFLPGLPLMVRLLPLVTRLLGRLVVLPVLRLLGRL